MRGILFVACVAIALNCFNPICAKADDYICDGKRVSESFARAMNLVNQAKEYLEDNKIEQAMSAAEQSVNLAPESPLTHLALAGAKARSGDYDAGIAECKKAIELGGNRAEMWMSLGNIYQAAGRSNDALDTLNDYLRRFPNDSHYNFIKSQVAIIQKEVNNRPSDSAVNAEDYFLDATKSGVVKWSGKRMPLTVFIESQSAASNFEATFPDLAKRSFDDWAQASAGAVRFRFVDQPESADINFKWSDNPKDVLQPAEGGEAKVMPGADGIDSASIKVLTVLPIKELKVNEPLIRFICLHEIGHSLGLIGHSSNRADIMYCSLPLNFEHCAISQRDTKTLRHLYEQSLASSTSAAGGIDATKDECTLDEEAHKQFADGHLSESLRLYKLAYAKHPNSKLLQHNLACIITQNGVEAMNGQKFEQASQLFGEALDINPTDHIAKLNLGISLMNCGILKAMQGQLSEAEPLYKKAIEVLDDSANVTVLATAVHTYSRYLTKVGRANDAQLLEAKYLKK